MTHAIAAFLPEIERLRRDVRSVKSTQLHAGPTRDGLHSLAQRYFSEVRPTLIGIDAADSEFTDVVFRDLLTISRRRGRKDKCLRLLKEGKERLVRLEGIALSRTGGFGNAQTKTPVDTLILESLRDICPDAALSYEQALRDIADKDRLSYRGPATDLREALREVLDALAPDSDVEAMPGFKLEPDTKRPTMKQKTRFIFRKRGYGAGQLSTNDAAIQGIEEIIGGIVRSVYTRSSVSTHIATERTEVLRVLGWVRMVLCELLALPS